MKLPVVFLVFLTTTLMAGTLLKDYRWEKRIIVFPKGGEAWVERLEIQIEGLKERDLVVHFLDRKKGEHQTSDALAAELRKMAPDCEKIHLIGKDGRTVLSWTVEDFSFKKLYGSIDSMPMRQREMREQKKRNK